MTTLKITSVQIDPMDLSPDARALHAHLQSEAFKFGVDEGWWREVQWAFPYVDIAVGAAARPGAPNEFLFRFECTGYSHEPTLATVWDEHADVALALPRRPTGSEPVRTVFRTDWEGGRYLYTPFDRHALKSHADWPARYSRTAWKPTSTLSQYLTYLHDLLNSRAYSGVAAA